MRGTQFCHVLSGTLSSLATVQSPHRMLCPSLLWPGHTLQQPKHSKLQQPKLQPAVGSSRIANTMVRYSQYVLPDTSDRPQHDIGTCLGLHIGLQCPLINPAVQQRSGAASPGANVGLHASSAACASCGFGTFWQVFSGAWGFGFESLAILSSAQLACCKVSLQWHLYLCLLMADTCLGAGSLGNSASRGVWPASSPAPSSGHVSQGFMIAGSSVFPAK